MGRTMMGIGEETRGLDSRRGLGAVARRDSGGLAAPWATRGRPLGATWRNLIYKCPPVQPGELAARGAGLTRG